MKTNLVVEKRDGDFFIGDHRLVKLGNGAYKRVFSYRKFVIKIGLFLGKEVTRYNNASQKDKRFLARILQFGKVEGSTEKRDVDFIVQALVEQKGTKCNEEERALAVEVMTRAGITDNGSGNYGKSKNNRVLVIDFGGHF